MTTARITHATLGAVYSHTPSQDWESDSDLPKESEEGCVDIATVRQLKLGKEKLAFGGGRKSFKTEEKERKKI